jgi:preprotein translocase subunit SecG
MLNTAIIAVNVTASLFLILTILLHSGRGTGMSDMFGGGGMSLSGGTRIDRLLDRATVITAIIWGLTTFWLAWRWNP